jgi:hypothetical protein
MSIERVMVDQNVGYSAITVDSTLGVPDEANIENVQA